MAFCSPCSGIGLSDPCLGRSGAGLRFRFGRNAATRFAWKGPDGIGHTEQVKTLERATLLVAVGVALALLSGLIRGGQDTFVLIAAVMAVGGLLALLLLARFGVISFNDRDEPDDL